MTPRKAPQEIACPPLVCTLKNDSTSDHGMQIAPLASSGLAPWMSDQSDDAQKSLAMGAPRPAVWDDMVQCGATTSSVG